ncbi:amidoligase family protein [Paenibacillus spongiae]|uniref:Amidoligase family protein n=1 Tax=Paenibacillus spongiae TaxID=2909671 RepID=A0ABY5S5P4_9BACL|nr:amidoligase family protein [Paenibacillus spongiae]UVI28895.1 amidoligase family protein [Paenibacillus spongiae]
MWPKIVDWQRLKFGVEIEFIGGRPEGLELLPDWIMSLDERQIDETGAESGSELKPPPILWGDRAQIRAMLARLREQGTSANWSCGVHVHVGMEPWGEDIVLPLVDAALQYQDAIQALMQTSAHRRIFCPPVTQEMRRNYRLNPGPEALRYHGRPQSHRCGINLAAWYDIGTVEFRYANGSLDDDEVINTVELYLRFVAAVGANRNLSSDPLGLAKDLGAPVKGYPVPTPIPRWFQERIWLEEAIIPAFAPLAAELVQGGEIHHVLPVSEGILIAVEDPDGKLFKYVFQPPAADWKLVRQIQ